MNDLIRHEHNFVSSEDLATIVEYATSFPEGFTEYGNAEKEFMVNILNDGPNVQQVRNILSSHDKKVYDYLNSNYDEIFENYVEMIHIARFVEGYGMHEHFDENKPKDIATLLYLNDDYEGGEIYFPDYDIYIKPKAGDLVTFPDNPNFVHGVRPISSGVRFTAPRWFTTK